VAQATGATIETATAVANISVDRAFIFPPSIDVDRTQKTGKFEAIAISWLPPAK
jgi:hypothetical protein